VGLGRGARLLGSADALLRTGALELFAADRLLYLQTQDRVRRQLGESTFGELWTAGQTGDPEPDIASFGLREAPSDSDFGAAARLVVDTHTAPDRMLTPYSEVRRRSTAASRSPTSTFTPWTLESTWVARPGDGAPSPELGDRPRAVIHQPPPRQRRSVDAAIKELINAYHRCDLPKVWGNGSSAAADGTKYDLAENSLLAEYSIRYGGYGGIAYHNVADLRGRSIRP
jgi:hypothetical protein